MNARSFILSGLALFGSALTALGQAPAAQPVAFEIHGTVVSGKTPLPGVAISAANSLTGKKVATSTDTDGRYALSLPGRGKYVVRAELTAFAAATSEAVISPATPQQKIDLQMILLSRVPKESTDGTRATAQQIAGALLGRGAQTLSVNTDGSTADSAQSGGDTPLAGMNALAGTADAGNQSVSVSGQMGNTQDFGWRGYAGSAFRNAIIDHRRHACCYGCFIDDR